MPQEIFSVPMIGSGTLIDPFRARYARDEFGGVFGLPVQDGAIRYSQTSTAILLLDAPQTYLDQVAAQADADRFCAVANLNDNIGGQGNTLVRDKMESINVPGDWSAASDSWRQTIRTIIGIFLFAQRHEGLNGNGFFEDLAAAGFGLNTQWQNLSPAFRSTMVQTITDLGFTLDPAPTQQVRSILKALSDKWAGVEFFIGSVSI